MAVSNFAKPVATEVYQLHTEPFSIDIGSYSSGTIGTRAAQKTVDLSNYISTYGKIVSVYIYHIDNSNIAHYQAFMSNNTLYVNAYRAVSEAASSYNVKVKVVFAKEA